MSDTTHRRYGSALALVAVAALAAPALAHGPEAGGFDAESGGGVAPAFDVIHARISTEGRVAVFHMGVSGAAGTSRPSAGGALAGAEGEGHPFVADPHEAVEAARPGVRFRTRVGELVE